jgi:hypothetical protein
MKAFIAALVISNTFWLYAWARTRRRAEVFAQLAATAIRNMVAQAGNYKEARK